ncbi:S49 family peptidase [Candidatus Methylospira mobilis]|uniref:S49 family peptidase n=1 Tax=Candidatus Methylospira mobilis TaxID=1808979 RepID=A0A5Q0BL72_9GAMM|nr:S49 family peptidase [Candidatus Methylospira mobilis]QFY42941.1 S49 family peptidase [Candidatus Methylospira mobilis]WNV03817.1 S49 family peptidase [Candidatus Methylospira mobilis]
MSESQSDHKAKAETTNSNQSNWERAVLEKLVFAAVGEQRRARYWGIFFKSLFAVYLGVSLWLIAGPFDRESASGGNKHTAVIDVTGVIAGDTESSADNIIAGLRDAADSKNVKGIILHLNTPGGSPVQAGYVYDEIRRVKKEKPDLPILAVVSDMCASGGYYIAAAADKIYVHPSSVVGSIGVIMNGFGFVDTIKMLGAERRLITGGAHKALLDPFGPVDAVEKERIQQLVDQIHLQFIDAVKQGRGNRLKETPDMFSGMVWAGSEAIALGLADDVGDIRHVAKDIIGAEDRVNYTPQEQLLDRLSHQLGSSFGHSISGFLESVKFQ